MKEKEEKPAITSSKQDITSSREENKDEAQLIDSIVVNCIKKQAGKGRVNKKDVPWNFCWDFLSPGGCRKGANCNWIHQSKANLAVPIPPPYKPPWGGAERGTCQYSGARQMQQNVGQMQCGVGQWPYDKVMRIPQFVPMLHIPSSRTTVPNLNVFQPREQVLSHSTSARAKGFIPRVTAKEFSPAGKYHSSNTSAEPEPEQIALGKQVSNLKLSSDPQSTSFGSFAAGRKSSGISGNMLGKLTPPSSPENTGFRKRARCLSGPWGNLRSPIASQDFQKLPMHHLDKFSPRSVATLPLLMPNVKDLVPYRAAHGKMVFLPPAAFPPRMSSSMPTQPLMGTSTRKRRNGGKIPLGPLFRKEPQRRPKLNSSLLCKNLPKDQDHRHNLYLNALSRAGLIPKNVGATGLTGSPERPKLINSGHLGMAPGGGFVDSSNQKKNPAMRNWHDDNARNTVNLNNSNVTQKFNFSKTGTQQTSTEVRGPRGDRGYSKVSPSSKKNETGDTTDCLASSAISPSNIFSPPFKVPVIKSHSGHRRSRGGRSKRSVRAVPDNSLSGIAGRGRGGNDPEKLTKFLKRGERVSCERLRGSRRGGYHKSSHN